MAQVIEPMKLSPELQALVYAQGLDRLLTDMYRLHQKHPMAMREIIRVISDARGFLATLEEDILTRDRQSENIMRLVERGKV